MTTSDRDNKIFTRGLNIGFFVGVLFSMAGMWFVFHQVA